MTNKELEMCDMVLHIPSSKKFPTMNVSHAATIILYELFQAKKGEKTGQQFNPASAEDKERILSLIKEKITLLKFSTDQKKRTQLLTWKKLLGKSNLTKRELMTLYGFMKKIK